MMNKTPFYILNIILWTTLVLSVVSCNGDKHDRLVAMLDNYKDEYKIAENSALLDSLELTGYTTEGDQMLINVLRFRNSIATSCSQYDAFALDQATKYYTSKDDHKMMAWCYMLQGAYSFAIDNSGSRSVDVLKKAEELSRELDEPLLSYAINQQLFNLNATIANYEKSLKYARLMERYSHDMGDSVRMLTSLYCQSIAFGNLAAQNSKEKAWGDSSVVIAKRCIPLLGNMKGHRLRVLLPYVLNNIGFAYTLSGHPDSALIYHEMSRKERAIPANTFVFAGIADRKGRLAEADSLYKLAIVQIDTISNIKHPTANLPALDRYYRFKMSHGQYEDACGILVQMIHVKDSLEKAHQVFLVNELQTKYDQEVKRRNLDRRLYQSVAIAVLLAIVVAGLIVYVRFRSIRQKSERLKMQSLLNAMQRQVLELEASGQDESKKIEALKERIKQMETDTMQSIYRGKQLYEHIVAGGNTATWHRSDFEDFIEYYKLLDFPFVAQAEESYSKLSPKNMFFLILCDMGKTNEEMMTILGVGASTIRTIRSRVSKQLIDVAEK